MPSIESGEREEKGREERHNDRSGEKGGGSSWRIWAAAIEPEETR
jgi:hypothetical protein